MGMVYPRLGSERWTWSLSIKRSIPKRPQRTKPVCTYWHLIICCPCLISQDRWMVAFSIIYILAAICLYRLGLGDTSLVYANILNLSARITYCLHFASTYFTNQCSQQYAFRRLVLPSWTLCITCTLSAVLFHLSKKQLDAERLAADLGRSAILNKSVLLHVGIGVTMTITCLWVWWRSSGRYLDLSVQRGKRKWLFIKGKYNGLLSTAYALYRRTEYENQVMGQRRPIHQAHPPLNHRS